MASLVELIRENLTNAYETLETKGVSISGYRNIQNLANNIDKISPQKVEQEQAIIITENKKTEVIPDSGKVLSKVSITTNVQPTLQEKTVTPTTAQQIITAGSGNDGLSSVTVEAVTAEIDSNIVAENIKKDVTILGVTGTLEQGGAEAVLGTLNVTSNGTYEAGNALSLEPGGLYEYKKVLPREVLADLYVIQQSKSEGLLISIPDYTFPAVAIIILKVDDEYVLAQVGMDGMVMSIYATNDVTFSIGAATNISVTAG